MWPMYDLKIKLYVLFLILTQQRYELLFKANEPKSGSSIYLQSKVVRAKERIELEMAKEKEKQADAEKSKTAEPDIGKGAS